jgi:translocation and assembly module TamA
LSATFLLALSLTVTGFAPRLNAEVDIQGVDGPLAENIRAFVELAGEPCNAERWRVRRRFITADTQISRALEAYGYYAAKLDKTLTWSDECWLAEFRIDAGVPVKLRSLAWTVGGAAQTDAAFAAVSHPDSLVAGRTFRHGEYRRAKQALQSLASDRGYFESRFESARIDIFPDEEAADVTLNFQSGPRYRFGAISIQQDFLDPEFVSRYIRLEPGTPYSSAELSSIQQDLNATGYFSTIEMRPEVQPNETHEVPVGIRLSPAKRINYGIGAGFSTDTGPRFRAEFENRRLNRRGHQLGGDLLVSKVVSEISGSYRRPLKNPDVEWLSFSAGVQFEDTDTANSDQLNIGVKRATKLARDWIRTEAVNLEFERFTVGQVQDDSRLLVPSLGFSRKRADQPINPRQGHYLGFELRGASDTLGSTTSFLQFTATGKLVRPMGTNGRLLVRASAGTTINESLVDLPPSVRFFAGGIDSVRGYGYETLGPEDAQGIVTGGSHVVTASVEYDRILRGNFLWAAFVDAGNAFDDGNLNMRVGAGIGLKWRSPIGPLRIYLAHPVNFAERSVRLHISIGPDL